MGHRCLTPTRHDTFNRDNLTERIALAASSASFDHAGDGYAERTAWVGKSDGLLARDIDGDGRITSGKELFGQYSQTTLGRELETGYQALATLDDNGDTFVDAQDRAWSQLRIWQDANSDGITDSGELKSLDQLGIASLDTTSTTNIINGSYGDTRAYSNFIWADGTLGQSADALFETNGKIARRGLTTAPTADILALPELPGSGELRNLRAAHH